MSQIFDIDQAFIKAVDDETARELIARLCRAELRAQGLPESAVTWGGDQRAKDGGVDVRVDSPDPLRSPDFIRSAKTVIQVKAEKFPASKIQNEMVQNGKLRPAILELKEMNGSYIIVSTRDDFSDLALQPRRDAIRKCLNDHELDTSVQSDFYDSRRIADWVEKHPAIATWLRQKIGQSQNGWQPYGPWAYDESNLEAEYLVDDRLRVFTPGAEEGSCISDAIAQLRSELNRPVSIRIVGLSGVGKTRLVQALFDPRVCPGSLALDSENVIYADLADELEPLPKSMLERLKGQGADSIIVIDNCGPDSHEQLTKIIKGKDCRLKLITVEYDIREDIPEDTLCYRLDGSSLEVIIKLLQARYKILSDSDANRIAEFSDGNARVAFALASTINTAGELSRLQNRELFERLFLQKNEPNNELLRCAEAASLVYSFNGLKVSPDGEIALLASFAEVTTLTFLHHLSELKRRGLLQERGRWRAVLPHAISNGLARRMLQAVPSEMLKDIFFEQGGERIARSFSRRLGYLHDCQEAISIASSMFAEGGLYDDLSELTEVERQVFVNLAQLDPKGAMGAILRAMGKKEFLSLENRNRTKFSRVVLSIAYEPEYFDEAALILKRFTLAEPEGYNREPVRDMLKSLFYYVLSGTQTTPEKRIKVVENLVSSSAEKERKLGLNLIKAGLKTSHFSSHYGVEFGARSRGYGWHPQSQSDVKNWFQMWIELAVTIGEQDDADGFEARVILGEAFRGLWGHVGLDDELVDVASRLCVIDGWPEGWLGVRQILQWDVKSLTPISLTQLRKLEKTLLPSDLITKIRACVLTRGNLAFDFELAEGLDEKSKSLSASEKYKRAGMYAEMLGTKVASSPELLETLIQDLCSNQTSQSYQFGLGIGKTHEDIARLLKVVRANIEVTDGSSINLIWVRGLLSGWNEVNPCAVENFLDEAIDDALWVNWFVELQVQVALGSVAFNRLIRALDPEKCPTWQFTYLSMGRATDPLTVTQILAIAKKLALRHDSGLTKTIDLLAMVIHCAKEKDEAYKTELGEALLSFLSCIDWSLLNKDHAQIEYDLGVTLEFALRSTKSESLVVKILNQMLKIDDEGWIGYSDVRYIALKPFFQYFPKLALDVVCNPDSDGTLLQAQTILSNSYSRQSETAISVVPQDVLIEWCDDNAELRYPFAAGTCKLYEKDAGADENEPLKLSETAVEIFKSAPDKSIVLSEFLSRFMPSGWSGSLAEILGKRLLLFDQLEINGHEADKLEIVKAKAELQKWIESEREREQRDERSRDSSFE